MASRAWLALLLVAVACSSRRGPRDVDNRHPRSTFKDGPGGIARVDAGSPVVAQPQVTGRKPRVLVKATTRSIATRGPLVYYGDAAEDGLYTIPKVGGEPTRVGHRAPVANGVATDRDAVVWIGSPGDTVLRMPAAGGAAAVVREHGIFSNLAGGTEIWLTEARGSGGVLVGASGAPTTGASFDSAPRGLAVDDEHVFVATQTKLLAIAKGGHGEIETLAGGEAFASPVASDDAVYATVARDGGRALVGVKKTGGAPEIVAKAVRDAPIALHAGTLYWFDAERPTLLARAPNERAPRVVAEDESYERAVAITVDDDGIFVATGTSDDGLVQIVPHR